MKSVKNLLFYLRKISFQVSIEIRLCGCVSVRVGEHMVLSTLSFLHFHPDVKNNTLFFLVI